MTALAASAVEDGVLACYGPGWGRDVEWFPFDGFTVTDAHGLRRLDLLMVREWRPRPRGHERHAVQVVVDVGQAAAVLRPAWWEPFAAIVHRCLVAAPAGLLARADLPAGCGLIEVDRHGAAGLTVKPARRPDPEELPTVAVVEALYRGKRARARAQEVGADVVAARVARLEARLADRDVELGRIRASLAAYRRREPHMAAVLAFYRIFERWAAAQLQGGESGAAERARLHGEMWAAFEEAERLDPAPFLQMTSTERTPAHG